MKSNKNTLINRVLWKRACKKIFKNYTTLKLRELYNDLLHNGYKSKFPRWKVQLTMSCCVDELSKRDKSC